MDSALQESSAPWNSVDLRVSYRDVHLHYKTAGLTDQLFEVLAILNFVQLQTTLFNRVAFAWFDSKGKNLEKENSKEL